MLYVRRAIEADIPALMALLVQVNRVHYEGRPDLFKPATKYTADELRGILADDAAPIFVCVDERGAVLGHGFCVFQQHVNSNLLTDVKTLYIDDICVDEAARGRGVGRAIYDHILDFARETGCYNVTLNVWSCNPGAMAFYEKLGLTPYKVGMEQIL